MFGYHFKRPEELHREHIEISGSQQRPIAASHMLVVEDDFKRKLVAPYVYSFVTSSAPIPAGTRRPRNVAKNLLSRVSYVLSDARVTIRGRVFKKNILDTTLFKLRTFYEYTLF